VGDQEVMLPRDEYGTKWKVPKGLSHSMEIPSPLCER
jgi:hypothetical protein